MTADRLVGRRAQLALLDEARLLAKGGQPQFVVLRGAAGTGKTRLIAETTARAEKAGSHVLTSGCVELGVEGLPLAPVTAVLRELVRHDGQDGLTALMPGVTPLLRLLPELGLPEQGMAHPAQLFDLFGESLRRLGERRPVLLTVDDLHWADSATRQLLGYLARTLRGARLLVVLACRADELAGRHPVRPFLAELERLPCVRSAELGAFSRAETAELVSCLTTNIAEVDRIFRRSAGNPFFAEELAKSGDAMPASLRDLLSQQIAQLPQPAQHVVAVAAVGGRHVPHGMLATAAGLTEPELTTALRAATEMGVLRVDGDGYQFRHGLLRDAAAAGLLPAEQVRLHRTYAEALTENPDLVTPDRRAVEAAYHWSKAREPSMALPALLSAAEAAARLTAHTEQARLLDRALTLWFEAPEATTGHDRPATFESAAAAATWGGDDLHALDLLDRAIEEIDQADAPGQAALFLAHRALVLHNLHRDGALVAAEEALLLSGASVSPVPKVLDLLSALFLLTGNAERAREVAEEAVRALAGQPESELEANVRATLGWAHGELGAYEAGLTALHQAEAIATRRNDPVRLARARLNHAVILHDLGRFETAAETALAGLDAARAGGLDRNLGALIGGTRVMSLLALGRWAEAEKLCTRTLDHDPPGPIGATQHGLLAQLSLLRGDRDGAREHLALARVLFGQTDPLAPADPAVACQEAELALQDGDLDAAAALLRRALPATVGRPRQAWPLLFLGARIAAREQLRARLATRGRQDSDLAAELRETASSLRTDTPLWAAYAASFTAETEPSAAAWADAATRWEQLGNPHALAYARLRAAEASIGAGDRTAAAGFLRDAAGIAEGLGAAPLADEIQVLARSAQLLPASPGPGAASSLGTLRLTERETDVLRLVTEGKSNPQIARQLFISAKTVSVHVSNVLGKLGVGSRGEAAATAHRLGLFAAEPDRK